MTISVAQQGAAMVQALGLGLGVGLLYDLLRVARVRLRRRWVGTVLDVFFWLAVTAELFFWSQGAWGGEVRLYGAAFLWAGAAVYFTWFSRPILKISYLGADLISFIWKIFTWPLRKVHQWHKNIQKILKKSFLFRKKWYKINRITGMLSAGNRRGASSGTGGNAHAVQTRGNGDQGGHPGSDGLYGHLSSEPAHTDPGGTGSA